MIARDGGAIRALFRLRLGFGGLIVMGLLGTVLAAPAAALPQTPHLTGATLNATAGAMTVTWSTIAAHDSYVVALSPTNTTRTGGRLQTDLLVQGIDGFAGSVKVTGVPVSPTGVWYVQAWVDSSECGSFFCTSNILSVVDSRPAPPPSSVRLPTPHRVAGASRYDTAVDISQIVEPASTHGRVFVTTGENYPDALAAGPAARTDAAPILLVTRHSIPDVTLAELQRLQPDSICIIGGTGVVSSAVQSALGHIAPTIRIAGVNRYDTALQLDEGFPAGGKWVYVATGRNFADAITAGAAAADDGSSLLLVDGSTALTADQISEVARLAPKNGVRIIGNTDAVSSAVASQLAAIAGTVMRFGDDDLYTRAVDLAAADAVAGETVVFATGANWPDGLAGAALGYRLILVPGSCVEANALNLLAQIGPSRILLLGGVGALSTAVDSLQQC